MRSAFLPFLLSLFAASTAFPQSSTAKKVHAKSRKTSSAKKAVSAPTWRNRQNAPTPERYRDIQQALVEKGYLKSEPNGIWDTQSADALRQFQSDQKLSVTGKISSATLIALGLGSTPVAPVEAPKEPPVEAAPVQNK